MYNLLLVLVICRFSSVEIIAEEAVINISETFILYIALSLLLFVSKLKAVKTFCFFDKLSSLVNSSHHLVNKSSSSLKQMYISMNYKLLILHQNIIKAKIKEKC